MSVKIVQTEGNAANVVNLAYELMVSSGTDIYEEGVQETYYLDEYDIAIKQPVPPPRGTDPGGPAGRWGRARAEGWRWGRAGDRGRRGR